MRVGYSHPKRGGYVQEYLPVLVPLIASIVTILAGLLSSWLAYRRGRSRSNAEVENLKVQKQSIEAAAGLSAAEAAAIISKTAADMLTPLTNRIGELQEQVSKLTQENTYLRNKVTLLETQVAMIEKHSELSGEIYPHLS